MIRSMTGFGRARKTVSDLNITVEIKSVNHRYFEFSSRVPRAYMFLDEKLNKLCRENIQRGKVEVSVLIEDNTENAIEIEVNSQFVSAYLEAIKKLSSKFRLKNDIKASSLIRNPDTFKIRQQSLEDDVVISAVSEVAAEAIESFINMRTVEGERLMNDVISRADIILSKVAFIEERSPETVKEYRLRLEQKIKELLGDVNIEEQRLLTETAIFADKIAVAEETVRLRSHIEQLKNMLSEGGAIGRKLDFIIQEMNREANTIGSKAQDIDIAHTVVDIKSEIEKIREQIQNIE